MKCWMIHKERREMSYPKVSVVTLISNSEGKVLMVKRRDPPFADR